MFPFVPMFSTRHTFLQLHDLVKGLHESSLKSLLELASIASYTAMI